MAPAAEILEHPPPPILMFFPPLFAAGSDTSLRSPSSAVSPRPSPGSGSPQGPPPALGRAGRGLGGFSLPSSRGHPASSSDLEPARCQNGRIQRIHPKTQLLREEKGPVPPPPFCPVELVWGDTRAHHRDSAGDTADTSAVGHPPCPHGGCGMRRQCRLGGTRVRGVGRDRRAGGSWNDG